MSTPTPAENWVAYADLVFATLGDALGIVQEPATDDPFVTLHLAAEYARARVMAATTLEQLARRGERS